MALSAVSVTLKTADEQPLAGAAVTFRLERGVFDGASSYVPEPAIISDLTDEDGQATVALHAGAVYRVTEPGGVSYSIAIPLGTTSATLQGLRAATATGAVGSNAVQTAIDAALVDVLARLAAIEAELLRTTALVEAE